MMNSKRWLCWSPVVVALLLLESHGCVAAEQAADPDQQVSRPRVGLVLGGGGARGAAHIGVLKELERLHIPIDAIVGTSMGAIVGGLYATGMNASDLEQLVGSVDWVDALSDKADRADLSFRRKQDDARFPIDVELGLQGTELVLPNGLIQGQKLDLLLRGLTMPVAGIEDFDRLPTPFRAVATDIERGEIWVMRGGDLAKSIRASMSVPGIFSPVRIGDRLLVDGGLVGNLAIDVVQAMDVDIVIAVDVEFPLYASDELGSVVAISEQMVTILIRKETLRQIDRLDEHDVLIRPDLGAFASTNFGEIVDTIAPGQAATFAHADQLQAIALDEASWGDYLASRKRPAVPESRLAFVRVIHDGILAHEVLESKLSVRAGDPIDHAVLAQNAGRLYGLQYFEQVSYRLVDEGEGIGVEYDARTKSWGPNYLQFGVALEDNFEGSTGFNLFTRVTRAGVNRLGAEWRSDLQLGTDPHFFSEFYQPLRFDSRIFVVPHAQIGQSNIDAFALDETVARLRLSEAQVGLAVGLELGRIGEIRVGAFRGLGETRIAVGDPTLPNIDFDTGGAFARLRFDTLDNARFPRHGWRGDLAWTLSRPGLGADSRFDTLEGELLQTWSMGKNSLQLGLSYATTLNSNSAVQDYFPLGGFLRLSGLESGQARGPHAALAKLVYFRRVGEADGIFDTPMYLGVSAEAGNVWQQRSDMSVDTLLLNGSVFAAFDTFIGPVYFAAGFGEQGKSKIYLFVGALPH